MGFHTYAYFFQGEQPNQETDFQKPDNSVQLWYWSKSSGSYDIQLWMKELYMKKKGIQYIGESSYDFFQTQLLLITKNDLHQMLQDIQDSKLDLQFQCFVHAALVKINEGCYVFYQGDMLP